MPRRLRVAPGGYVYHVLNRTAGRVRIFGKPRDYRAFEDLIAEAKDRLPMRVLAWCVMPNHFHLVLWPRHDGDLSEFMRWLTLTHTRRWQMTHGTAAAGPLYVGRFHSFPIQKDDHLPAVLRYVERNPLRAKLVKKAEAWRWSSLWHRIAGNKAGLIDDGPAPLPRRWRQFVQSPPSEAELSAVRLSVARDAPFGEASWQERTAKRLDLESSLRPRGRPRKTQDSRPH
jgi:putative transposase